ncbi:MAG TPA: ATP-binding cassette domain-containing protein [Verrucomicrobiae bacterium]|nr:ATP-binding cassette domain-containing protein [Verrucomicrobiae bacterium]
MDTRTSPPRKELAMEMAGVTVTALNDPRMVMVENVNWSVSVGDYWVVGGLQGSGKTDLMELAEGLIPPQQGVYRLFGHEMPIYGEHLLAERLRIGLVFDGGNLFNQLTVWENVSLPIRYHKNLTREQAEQQTDAMLQAMELTPWRDTMPGALGLNWRKRVGLARALMPRPEVLLLDNPIAGLDVRHRNWWLNFLDQLSAGHALLEKRPMTLVATAGDLRPWTERARQFAILKDKRLVVIGGRAELPGHSEPMLLELMAAAA